MADNTVAITAGSGTSIRTVTNAGADSGAHQQVVSLGDSAGNLNPSFPDGSMSIDTGSHNIFIDTFDTNANSSWGLAGTVTPTWVAGTETLPLPTTLSATSYMQSPTNVAATLFSGSYVKATFLILHEATATTNNARFWGIGTWAGSPTAAAPVTNGVGFELDPTTGGLLGVAFSAGTRTQTVTLTRQADAAYHRYSIYFRQSKAFFEIDGTVVGSIAYPNLAQSQSLKILIGSFNATSAASQATTFSISSASLADTAQNAVALMSGDPLTGYNRATIKPGNSGAATGDTSLVVTLNPISGLPAGANAIGSVIVSSHADSGSTSGTLSATDALAAAPDGAGTLISTAPTANSYVQYNIGTGNGVAYSTLDIQVTGTFGSGTLWFEGSVDQTNWVATPVVRVGALNAAPVLSTTTAGVFRMSPAGFQMVRARIRGATSPSVTVVYRASLAESVLASNGTVLLSDGTNIPAIKGSATPPATADSALTVAVSPNTPPIGVTNVSSYMAISAATTNALALKASAGTVLTVTISNPTATAAYFKLYNTASTPTAGTTVPVAILPVPATSTAQLTCGAMGIRFATGIGLTLTGAITDADTTSAVAGVHMQMTYI